MNHHDEHLSRHERHLIFRPEYRLVARVVSKLYINSSTFSSGYISDLSDISSVLSGSSGF